MLRVARCGDDGGLVLAAHKHQLVGPNNFLDKCNFGARFRSERTKQMWRTCVELDGSSSDGWGWLGVLGVLVAVCLCVL